MSPSSSFLDAWIRYESTLHDPKVAASPPADGIDDETMAAIRVEIAPLRMPRSVVELAERHDGGLPLGPLGLTTLSLTDSLDYRRSVREFLPEARLNTEAEISEHLAPFPSQWLPIAAAPPIVLVVELTPEERADSPVWQYSTGEPLGVAASYSSIAAWLDVAAEALLVEPDDYNRVAVTLDRTIDAEYGKHETVETFPEGWPDRWDRW